MGASLSAASGQRPSPVGQSSFPAPAGRLRLEFGCPGPPSPACRGVARGSHAQRTLGPGPAHPSMDPTEHTVQTCGCAQPAGYTNYARAGDHPLHP